jgi:hypothetical protein
MQKDTSTHSSRRLYSQSTKRSAESLQYFYTENAFVSFEASVPLKVHKLHRTGFKLLPESRVRSCRNFTMSFQRQLVLQEYTSNSAGLEIGSKMFAILLPGTYLFS